MKKELRKPVRETSQLRVHAYDGEACVNGNNNDNITISGSDCNFTNAICISILDWIFGSNK